MAHKPFARGVTQLMYVGDVPDPSTQFIAGVTPTAVVPKLPLPAVSTTPLPVPSVP